MPTNQKTDAKDFTTLADVLKDQIRELTGDKFVPSIQLQTEWQNIVGLTIAAHSRVLYQKNNTVFIGVDNSTWLNELTFIKSQILNGINQGKKDQIKELRFKITPKKN